MAALEAQADSLDGAARAGQLPQSCFHVNETRLGALKRTKMFFGARCEASLVPEPQGVEQALDITAELAHWRRQCALSDSGG